MFRAFSQNDHPLNQCEHFNEVWTLKNLYFLLVLAPPINPIIFNPHNVQVESANDIALKNEKKN